MVTIMFTVERFYCGLYSNLLINSTSLYKVISSYDVLLLIKHVEIESHEQ